MLNWRFVGLMVSAHGERVRGQGPWAKGWKGKRQRIALAFAHLMTLDPTLGPWPLALDPPLSRAITPRPRDDGLADLHAQMLSGKDVEPVVDAGKNSRHRRLERLAPVILRRIGK